MSKRPIYYFVAFLLVLLVPKLLPNTDIPTDDFSKKVKISLRAVGNDLLLSNQDSTSLILPVKELDVFQYEVSFQNDLLIHPDSLVNIVKRSINKSELSENYRVEVFQCSDNEVAYSYEINSNEEKTIIPCGGRALPISCYSIQFQFIESTGWLDVRIITIAIVFIVLFLLEIFLFRKKSHIEKEERSQNYTSIGSFQFYPQQNKLIKEAAEIALSKKECELLEIFVANPNEILKREDLMKKVWEDNGVFVGRSLDTYISKLRKKLQDDDTIKISNVHGVGYKLEINR